VVLEEVVEKRAEEWLLEHGYSRFEDGTWSRDGHEVDVVAALAEYVEEVAASEEVDHSRE